MSRAFFSHGSSGGSAELTVSIAHYGIIVYWDTSIAQARGTERTSLSTPGGGRALAEQATWREELGGCTLLPIPLCRVCVCCGGVCVCVCDTRCSLTFARKSGRGSPPGKGTTAWSGAPFVWWVSDGGTACLYWLLLHVRHWGHCMSGRGVTTCCLCIDDGGPYMVNVYIGVTITCFLSRDYEVYLMLPVRQQVVTPTHHLLSAHYRGSLHCAHLGGGSLHATCLPVVD